MEEKVFTVPGNGNEFLFKKESELTLEDIGYHIGKITQAYNDAPLVARDYFTRGLISTVGITPEILAAVGLKIDLTPPENEDPNARKGLII